MCGIAGVLRLDGAPVDAVPVERMVDAMAHRGPDGQGSFRDGPVALGHLRLSILDPTPAGAQPMTRSGTVLVHNGEIYTYLELAEELRAEGERFETGTDTEVILAAYRAWGPDAVARFNGMFALAIWDPDRRRLLLARDRMGVKPLYLRRSGRSLAFASEVGALVAAGPLDERDGWRPEPHLGVMHDFLGRARVDHSDQTFVEGIVALPPGHLLVVEDGMERTIRYWGPPELADDARQRVTATDLDRDRALVDEFLALFDSSVGLRLRSDVPIGSCLSGGLDSSAIVATVAELIAAGGVSGPHEQQPRLAFHARFPSDGLDESAFANLVAERAGARLSFQTPAGEPLLASMLPILRAQGEPYRGASINAQYAVMRAAHEQGLKVLLDGQGADELLGGYLQMSGLRTVSLLRAGHPRSAATELRGQVSRGIFSPAGAMLSGLLGVTPAGLLDASRHLSGGRLEIRCLPPLSREPAVDRPDDQVPGTLLARRLWGAMTGDGLPALLRYEDRNSMAFGLEARVPFLDVRVVELAARLPDRLRIDRGVTKVILRRAMRDRLPDAIVDRRDKTGFVAPQARWLDAGHAEVAAILRGGQLVERGWVAPDEVERILGDAPSARRITDQLWRLVVAEAWLRQLWPDASAAGSDAWEAALEQAGSTAPQPADAVPDAEPGPVAASDAVSVRA